jgi:alpha-1,6-mannosyltransferase
MLLGLCLIHSPCILVSEPDKSIEEGSLGNVYYKEQWVDVDIQLIGYRVEGWRYVSNVLVIALISFSYWLEKRWKRFVYLSIWNMMVFRCELTIMYLPIFLYEMWKRHLNFKSTLLWALQASVMSIIATVLFDSWFWKRWLWPEFEVWYFNTILNQSHLWGTKPFHYYFTRVIPRAFLFNLPAIIYGLWKASGRRSYGLIMIFFVFTYSFLPHKELRFIIYTFPLFCMYGAWGWSCIYQYARKSKVARLFSMMLPLMLILTFSTCLLSLYVSVYNYPGGMALFRLHRLIPKNVPSKWVFWFPF